MTGPPDQLEPIQPAGGLEPPEGATVAEAAEWWKARSRHFEHETRNLHRQARRRTARLEGARAAGQRDADEAWQSTIGPEVAQSVLINILTTSGTEPTEAQTIAAAADIAGAIGHRTFDLDRLAEIARTITKETQA